jgi:DNA-binding CsgD family transcriptional regulator
VAGSESPGNGATWRVFLSHTFELRDYPPGWSYVGEAGQVEWLAVGQPMQQQLLPLGEHRGAASPQDGGGRKRPPTGWASLTPAERGVVRFVGEGLRNDAIARRLFIAPGTVKVHLSHIFAKLGITSRAELAAQAASHDLTAR